SLRPDRPRPDAEAGLASGQDGRPGGRPSPSDPHDRRVSPRETADAPRTPRLQPERLGPHPRLGVLGASPSARLRVDARHLARGRTRLRGRGLPHRQPPRARPPTRGSVGAVARRRGTRRSRAFLLTPATSVGQLKQAWDSPPLPDGGTLLLEGEDALLRVLAHEDAPREVHLI